MRVLFLLQSFPYPPNNGISMKLFNLLKHLSARGWGCDLLCFGPAGTRVAELEGLLPGIKVLGVIPPASGLGKFFRKVKAILGGLPPSLGEFDSEEYRSMLAALSSEKYDVVHYDLINMAQYLEAGPDAPSILSSNDAISLSYLLLAAESRGVFKRAYLRLAAWLIQRYERKIFGKFVSVHVVSDADADYLRQVCPGLALEVIPITAEDSFLGPVTTAHRCTDKEAPRLVFTGNLEHPIIAEGLFEFLRLVYPTILRSYPHASLHILGPKASASNERRIRNFPNVEYLRWAQDYRAFLAAADVVLVLDRYGTGIKTRVLDAMALGKPVIGTKVAFGGIAAVNGSHCFYCDNPQETSESLSRLLASPTLRKEVGDAARVLIRSSYSMSAVGPKWENFYFRVRESAGTAFE